MLTSVLLAFTPLLWAFVPCNIDKKGKHKVNGNHSNYSSIKVAVGVGHSKGAWKKEAKMDANKNPVRGWYTPSES